MNKLIQCFSVAILAAMTGTAIATTEPAPSSLGSAIVNSAVEANKRQAAAQAHLAAELKAQADYAAAYVPGITPCINQIITQINNEVGSQYCKGDKNSHCIGLNRNATPSQCLTACNNAYNTIVKQNNTPALNSANYNDNNINECNMCSILIYQTEQGNSMPYGITQNGVLNAQSPTPTDMGKECNFNATFQPPPTN
jgi:hypothetical protein